jgi:hypothetical protein
MVENEISTQKKFSTDIDPNIGETTEVSWTAPEGMDYDAWSTMGCTLQTVHRSMRWWLGDWLNHGDAAYGEMYTQAILATDSAVETLKKYKAIAQRIRKEDRMADLSWTHHFVVAYLPQDEHGPLLSIAEFHGLTSREFRTVCELPDDERAHLIDLWLNFDGPDHQQTLTTLRTLEKFGTIYLPEEEEDEDNIDGPDSDGETTEHDIVIDGEEIKYNQNSGDRVFDFWKKRFPLRFADDVSAEWEGIRVVAVMDEDGDPLLLWDMVSVE